MRRSRQLLLILILVTILLFSGLIVASLARSGLDSWLYLPTIQKSELATQATPIPTPTQTQTPTPTTLPVPGTVTGTVLIEDGICCIGGTAGEPLDIDAVFTASSSAGEVTEMRVHTGGFCADESLLGQRTWEPFITQSTYVYTPPINWSGFYVSVQFRDEFGNVSPVVCDDISVEGMPSEP